MTTKITLPGENWAILKDPMDITERQARGVQRKFMDYGRRLRGPVAPVGSEAPATPDPTATPVVEVPDDEKMDVIEEMEHYLIAYFLSEWSFDFKPSAENLYNVPRPVYNALDQAAQPLIGELVPQLKKDDEDSPTTP